MHVHKSFKACCRTSLFASYRPRVYGSWSGQWIYTADFINSTGQVIFNVYPTHILQGARARDSDVLGIMQSVNENLWLYHGVKKIAGWSLMTWNRVSPDLYPSNNPTTNPCDKSMLEDGPIFEDWWIIWLEIFTIRSKSVSSGLSSTAVDLARCIDGRPQK